MDFEFISDRILEEKLMQVHFYFAWMKGWMGGKDLGRNLERTIAFCSWGSGMCEAVSVP